MHPSSLSSPLFVSTFPDSKSTTASRDGNDKDNSDINRDLANVEFIASHELLQSSHITDNEDDSVSKSVYPFATMLKGSARFISQHVDEVAVMHLPRDLLDKKEEFATLMSDVALSWTLGMKLVLVVGNQLDAESEDCSLPGGFLHDDDHLTRKRVEDAGYVRFEVERTLNRFLRRKCGMSPSTDHAPILSSNVIGGNFYTAQPYGFLDMVDCQHTGYPTQVNAERIQQVLNNNDLVLLTSVGASRLGESVSVNGNQLAATVAAALQARKLIFMSSKGCVLRQRGASKTLQEVSLGFVNRLLAYYRVAADGIGYMSSFEDEYGLSLEAQELLMLLGWSSWALEEGAYRAHIVNPGDGALLEELFTSKNGANTCVYRENEASDLDLDEENNAASFRRTHFA